MRGLEHALVEQHLSPVCECITKAQPESRLLSKALGIGCAPRQRAGLCLQMPDLSTIAGR